MLLLCNRLCGQVFSTPKPLSRLSEIQWAAFILLCVGCTTAQFNPSSDHVLQTPFLGWMMAIVMALLSGFASVYTEVKGVY
ncbi:Nucleotide-sugar transporter [Artemisia annua]|uniref:Nucleotide-sugar transporter n=1 Tax=Artemisia annua TaxID=35608 RepID=A0A2U1M074_ARTAN|nr:Nucleotide-sugar transporter [Artemisia annua]